MTDPHDPDRIDDDALTRALRAPGTPDELRARDDYLAMFRAQVRAEVGAGRHPRPAAVTRRAHFARRFGGGAALAGVLALGGGGFAAAYAGTLPEPLQRAAHRVLAPLGPLGAPPAEPERQVQAEPTPSARPTPTPTPKPSVSPSPSKRPSPSPSERESKQPKPSASPSATPTDSPTPSPTLDPSLPPPVPTEPTGSPTDAPTSPTPTATPTLGPRTVSIRTTATRVVAGMTSTFSGTVTAQGKRPVTGTPVFLERRGPSGWESVANATSDDDGAVTIPGPVLLQTSTYRLSAGTARSPLVRVQLVPVLSTSANTSGQLTVLSVTARGGNEGDAATVVTRRKGRTTVVGRGRLDADGSVSFALERRAVATTYVVLLRATSKHTEVSSTIDLPAYVGTS